MIGFLAQWIAAIGAAMHTLAPHSTEPEYCSQRGSIKYCYYQGEQNTDRVIYFMHGFGDDVYGWTVNFVTGEVQKNWKANGIVKPHVVSIDRGVWWYTEVEQGQELANFVEWFEKEKLGFTPKRTLYGDSMGGHNALRWSADFPNLFPRMAIICPAIPRSFVQNPPPSEGFPAWEFLAQQLISEYYNASPRKDFNPTVPYKIERADQSVPRIHLIASTIDDFGFYAGDVALHDSLSRNPNVKLSYEVQAVKHCEPEVSQLAAFLSE